MTRNLFFRYLRFIKPTLCSVNEKYLLFTNSLYILYDFRKFIGSRNSDILLTNSINWKRLPFFWVMSGFLRVSFCCLGFQKRENMGVPRGRIEGIKEKKFKNKGIKKSPNSPLDRFRLLKDLYLTT